MRIVVLINVVFIEKLDSILLFRYNDQVSAMQMKADIGYSKILH
jgi:hypothetical protein